MPRPLVVSSARSPRKYRSCYVKQLGACGVCHTHPFCDLEEVGMAANQAIVDAIVDALPSLSKKWSTPLLIGVFGLPATGKTELTRWLASHYPLIALSTDALRLRYRLASGPATHEVLYNVAARLLPLHTGIVFDGIHMGRIHRRQMGQFAEHYGGQSLLVHTVASPDVIAARLEARRKDEQKTISEEKFVISHEHFIRIARMLEEPLPEEGVWRIDTAQEDTDAVTAPLQQRLMDLLVR